MNNVNPDGPGSPQSRGAAVEPWRQLRAILMRWDPIGIADEPMAADEYDCLIPPLLQQLRDGVPQSQLNGWLGAELEDHFGLDADAGREAALAAELIQWWRLRSVDSTS